MCSLRESKGALKIPFSPFLPEPTISNVFVFTRGGHGNPLQYSSLENPMDREAWQATVWESQRVRHNWVTLSLVLTTGGCYHLKLAWKKLTLLSVSHTPFLSRFIVFTERPSSYSPITRFRPINSGGKKTLNKQIKNPAVLRSLGLLNLTTRPCLSNFSLPMSLFLASLLLSPGSWHISQVHTSTLDSELFVHLQTDL